MYERSNWKAGVREIHISTPVITSVKSEKTEDAEIGTISSWEKTATRL